MNTFPILAAADPVPLPAPGSASHGTSGENTDFSHVLRRLDSGTTASVPSGAAGNPPKLCSFSNSAADAAPAQDKSAIFHRAFPLPSGPSTAPNAAMATEGVVQSNGVASHGAKNAEHNLADGAAGATARQVATAGTSILLHAKDKIKEAAAKEPADGEKARSSTAAAAAVSPAAAVPTPDKASLLTATLASAGSAVTLQQVSGTESAKAPLDQPPGFPGEAERSPRNAQGYAPGYAAESALPGTAVPTARISAEPAQSAAVSPADPSASTDDSSLAADGATVSANSASAGALSAEIRASTSFGASQPTLPTMREESAPRAPSSSIAAAAGARPKAQAATSSDKAGGPDVSAGGNEAASALQMSASAANFRASPALEDFMQGGSPVDHSTFRSGVDSSSRQPKTRSRSQTVSQADSSSATQENSVGVERDANAGLAAEGGQHTLSFQPASLPPASVPAPAALDTAQSVAHSAAVVLPQPSGDTAEAAAQPQPKLPSNPLPDPHRMVDSGQLRMGENNSELKVSVQLPELGKIEVRAVTSHDVTTAHLTASHHDALQVLSADRSGLEEALKSRDVILGSLDSYTQRHSGGQQSQENAPSSAPSSAGTPSAAAKATSLATEEAARAGFLPDYSSISVRA